MKILRPLPKEKKCGHCKRTLPVGEFNKKRSKDSPRGFYFSSYCRGCNKVLCSEYGKSHREARNRRLREWRRANPQLAKKNDRRGRIRKHFGISVEEYDTLLARQNGRCAICGKKKPLGLDHNHKTGQLRGFVCADCNNFIRLIEIGLESGSVFRILSEYLGIKGLEQANK